MEKKTTIFLMIGGLLVLGMILGLSFKRSAIQISPTPSVENAWKVYENPRYHYKVSYPEGATLGETEEAVGIIYGIPEACTYIRYKSGFVLIWNEEDSDGPCGPTGVGLGNIAIEETFVIGGKSYKSKGFRYNVEEYYRQSQAAGLPQEQDPENNTTDEFASLDLGNNMGITYGLSAEQFLTSEEYNHTREVLKGIIESYKRNSNFL